MEINIYLEFWIKKYGFGLLGKGGPEMETSVYMEIYIYLRLLNIKYGDKEYG